MRAIRLVIKNYNQSPFFFLVWILIGSLFGSIVNGKEEMSFKLLIVILSLIILNGLFAFAIGYFEINQE